MQWIFISKLYTMIHINFITHMASHRLCLQNYLQGPEGLVCIVEGLGGKRA